MGLVFEDPLSSESDHLKSRTRAVLQGSVVGCYAPVEVKLGYQEHGSGLRLLGWSDIIVY